MAIVREVLRLLKNRGFLPVASRGGQRSFEGALFCARGPVRVKLSIADWNFITYPVIHLEEHPTFLPALMPHIDVLGNLCYFAPGAVTLDRYDPATAVMQCLNQATALLDRIATDPTYRDRDIQNEFLAHWEYGQLAHPWPVLLGDIEPGDTSAGYFIMEVAGIKRVIISSDTHEVSRLAKTFGSVEIPSKCRCWLFKSIIPPAVPERMPQTVKDLFAWLKLWDRDLSYEVQQVLGRPDYLQHKFATFAVDTPVGWLGFGFDLNHMKRLGYKRAPKCYRNFLHNKGGEQPLLRLSIQQVGGRFVHSRNLAFPDLHNKRVTVVGCGAIGSFVTQALIRLGAGTGKLGLLKLIDPDSIGSENLGRHVLGYPSLLQPKANALAEELLRQFPHSNVEPVSTSVFEHHALFASDLVIDATGEEAVSEFLNGLRIQRRSRVPFLHVWIRGNGEAVQALWTDLGTGGCYRCLLLPDAMHHRKERFNLLKREPEQRSDGCRAFTPYAISAPMQAAALAIDMVCAWLQGNPTPRFRTRSLETADVFAVKCQDLSRIKGCPACGHL